MRRRDRSTSEDAVRGLAVFIVLTFLYIYFKGWDIVPPLYASIFLLLGIGLCTLRICIDIGLFQKKTPVSQSTDYREPEKPRIKKFHARFFLHPSEYRFFPVLKAAINEIDNHLIIVPKIGLWAAVENLHYADWNKINQKHIDFGIFDPSINRIVLAIELDGASHDSLRTLERDRSKNEILTSAGIPLLRIRVTDDYNVDRIREDIEINLYRPR